MRAIIFKMVFILAMFSCVVSAQEKKFKEVKTAQDVIDNYMEANGGRENLMKIKSISFTATAAVEGTDYPFNLYIGSDAYYMNFKSPVFNFSIAYDGKNKKGWSKFGEQITDMKQKEIERYQQTVESALWKYYYDKDKYGITYEMLENEKVNNREAYVIDFKKGGNVILTSYFDTANFNRLKNVSQNNMTTYDDFKEVNGTRIIMAFTINSQESTLKVTKFEFNTKFDKSLLEKPEK